MKEFRRIYCRSLDELPALTVVRNELKEHDRLRIDYDQNAEFKGAERFNAYLHMLRQELHVDIHQGAFKELEFYNIYRLFPVEELELVSQQLEAAVKDYRLTCERFIKAFETKYNFGFADREKSTRDIRAQLEADQNHLSKNLSYRFHGGDICFTNKKTGQMVDISLKFPGSYGVIDFWFFQYFMETTTAFKSLAVHFKENTPKLLQTLEFLNKIGRVQLIRSTLFDSQKFIWKKG